MIKLLLSSGHGGNDSGAIGNGLNERDYCFDFVNRIHWILMNCYEYYDSFECIRVPNGANADDDVKGAVDFVNANYINGENTLAVDYHLNSFQDPDVHGWEIFCYNDQVSNFAANRLASLIKSTYDKLGIDFRGVKDGENKFGFISNTTPVSFIFELVFVTNLKEANILKGWDSSEQLAYGHAKALLDTLGVNYTVKQGTKFN